MAKMPTTSAAAGRRAREQRKYRSGNVTFLGEIEDVRLPLAAGDIFILPTIYDPFSNASLEAMAQVCP